MDYPLLRSVNVPGGGTGGLTAVNGANAATMYPIGQAFKLVEVWYMAAVAQTTASAVITAARVKATGTSVTIGTFPIATTLGVGDIGRAYFATLGDTEFAPGEWLTLTSGGEGDTGEGYFGALIYEYPTGPNAAVSFSEVAKIPVGTGNVAYIAVTEV